MGSDLQFDLSGFRAGLRRKLAVTKRAVPDVINQASKNVCLRAVQFTPKADPSKIEAQLARGGIAFRLLQTPAMQGKLPPNLRGFTRGTHTRAQIIAAVKKLIAARRRAVASLKAGWIKASQEFGGGRNRKVSDKGLPGKSYGKRASTNSPVAEGGNTARGATKIGAPALQQALDFVGKDMTDYAEKKLAGLFNR